MAVYGGNVVVVKIGSNDISAYIQEISGIELEAKHVEGTAFGASWDTFNYANVQVVKPFTMKGFYDDTATTGPDALLGAAAMGTTVTFKITYGASKSTQFSAIITGYKRLPKRNELTMAEYMLQPSGATVET